MRLLFLDYTVRNFLFGFPCKFTFIPRQYTEKVLVIGGNSFMVGGVMSKRWLSPWKDSLDKPAIYHCISRVVDRRFVFGDTEREQFRMIMRMMENFSGCRVLSYCIMSNHFHLLLEVPPMPAGGLTDEELLKRLRALYSDGVVNEVAQQLSKARAENLDTWVAEIHARYTYRMHDLSQFMKTLIQRMTRWYNRINERSGTLWEERYKSVIVESGIAARTMAAYIDLNPVRAGMVGDPAQYRWSSYGEAVGGGAKGNGKKAREGLVRACMSHRGAGFEAEKWKEVAKVYRKMLGLALERKSGQAGVEVNSAKQKKLSAETKKSLKGGEKPDPDAVKLDDNDTVLPEMRMAEMLRHRIRYFSAGAIIGSKAFVNEAFASARERFSERRKDGARRMKGNAAAAADTLWSARDLRLRE
jgi:putative transposase